MNIVLNSYNIKSKIGTQDVFKTSFTCLSNISLKRLLEVFKMSHIPILDFVLKTIY